MKRLKEKKNKKKKHPMTLQDPLWQCHNKFDRKIERREK